MGSHTEIADRIAEYAGLGITEFILSGYPHLEECYRFAELVMPKLPLAATTGVGRGVTRNAGPFGEMIANEIAPAASAPVPLRRVAAAG